MAKTEFNESLLKVKKKVIVETGEKTETRVELFTYNGGEEKVRIVMRGLNDKWEKGICKPMTLDKTRKVIAGMNEVMKKKK